LRQEVVVKHLGGCRDCYATYYYDEEDIDENSKPKRKAIGKMRILLKKAKRRKRTIFASGSFLFVRQNSSKICFFLNGLWTSARKVDQI